MTSRAPQIPLRRQLRARHQALRAAVIAHHALRAAASIAVVIALAVASGLLRPPGPMAAWARLALVASAGVAALVVALARARREIPVFDRYLEQIEERLPLLRSLLRNAIDLEASAAAHTSGDLADALRAEAARALEGAAVSSLKPRVAPRSPLLAMTGAAALIAVLTLAQPAALRRSWITLFDPRRAAPEVTLAVEPGSVRLSPGSTLSIRARVTGTRGAPRLVRAQGPAPGPSEEPSVTSGERVWRFDLPPVTHEDRYRVRVSDRTSPLYTIALAGEPQPVSFDIELRPPAYARLPVQRGSATRGDLSALRGSLALVEVTFDRDLASLVVHVPGGRTARFQPISARRWRGALAVNRDGEWTLEAAASTGGATFRYPVRPLEDAPPMIAVRVPEGDQDLPAGQSIPLEVLGQDDLGLSSLELESHKDAAAPWRRETVSRFDHQPREARVASHWDATSLGLLPGESATFRFVLYDNDAFGRGRAVSPTFTLRFPSLAEMYENVTRRQDAAQGTLAKAAEQSRELQKKLDQLARQAAATPSSNSFERREEFKNAFDRQQDLSKKLDQAAQDLRQSLEQAAERRAFSEELQRRMHELQQLVQQIESPEFREAMKRIQQALEHLDRRALDERLPDWRRENQEMLSNLERNIDLLKQLRDEEKLDALARRAEELERRQNELNREHERSAKATPPGENAPTAERQREEREARARAQEKAAEDSKQLGSEVRESAKTSEEKSDEAQFEQAADQLEQEAAEAQQQAAGAERQGQPGQSKKSGESASKSLSEARQKLSSMAQKMAGERQGVDLAAVRRGAQDLLSLQRGSEENTGKGAPSDARADRATDLSEGVARVADSLAALSRRTPFITPQLGQALGQAMERLSASGRELGLGNRQEGERAGREGSMALNQAVLELRQTENSMCKNPSQPGGQSAGQQMSELGEQQAQVNGETRKIAHRLSAQLRMTAGDEAEMRQLAGEQQRIREQLEALQRDEERDHPLLGRLDAARRDMQEVEEELRAGPPGDDLEQKQQHILSRLLDAARSVNRRDYNPERESRPGEESVRLSPAPLPADLLRESDRLRLDLLKSQEDRYPAQYRAFIEAYLRALNGTPR